MTRLQHHSIIVVLCLSAWTLMQAQVKEKPSWHTEFLYGISAEANDFFPERDPQCSLILGMSQRIELAGKTQAQSPKIGLLGMYTDLGNKELLGHSYALIPYVSFPVFGKRWSGSQMQFGLGGAYFDTRFDPETNFFNQAVTTDLTWAFRASIHQRLFTHRYGTLDAGLVYNHQSNGHTKLPNQGLNSFLLSLRQTWHGPLTQRVAQAATSVDDYKLKYERSSKRTGSMDQLPSGPQEYLEMRFGYGLNVLALAFNDLRPVRTFAITWGKTHKGHLRWGVGVFYRFYQHYHDYIQGNESLVRPGQEFESFRVNPWRYGSNFGLHLNGEVLLGHFGVSTQLGLNLYKPAYGIDWRINEGWDYPPRELPPNWVLGEYNTKYQLKKHISTRLGLRYYLWDTRSINWGQTGSFIETIRVNPFIGGHINANLGQADFSELSFGMIIHLGKPKP
ncbi:MAG: acyloxyacyl hydrolase [Flavobacteriaceae bacterium]